MKVLENNPLLGLLFTVWLYLLGLCLFIGFIIVPFEIPTDSILYYVISIGKVLISLLLVGLWLVAWYKVMKFVLDYELSKNTQLV